MIGLALGDGLQGPQWKGEEPGMGRQLMRTSSVAGQRALCTSGRSKPPSACARTSSRCAPHQSSRPPRAEAATRLDLVSACWAPHKAQHSAASFVRTRATCYSLMMLQPHACMHAQDDGLRCTGVHLQQRAGRHLIWTTCTRAPLTGRCASWRMTRPPAPTSAPALDSDTVLTQLCLHPGKAYQQY